MNRNSRYTLLVSACLLLALSACAAISLVDTERRTVLGAYSVEPQIQWSQFPRGDFVTWSADGIYLEALRFAKPVTDGNPIYKPMGVKQEKLRVFRKGMTPNEVMELMADTLSTEGAGDVHTYNLEPYQFGSSPGFRFNIDFTTEDGLEMEGIAAGTIEHNKLYMIFYSGAREHYFALHRDAVEQLLASLQGPM